MTTKLNPATVSACIDLLVRAASAAKVAADATKAVADQRMGAYALYVKGAALAKNAETFLTAANAVEAEIRKTGQAGGKPCGAVKATGEGAEGYKVPMSFSAAKSILGKALSNSVPMTEKDKKGKTTERSYNAIRKDVFALNAAERAEKEAAAEAERLAKGPEVERIRATDGKRILAELESVIGAEENAADLADLLRRVSDAMRDYGFQSEEVIVLPELVPALVEAAAEPAPKARKGRKAKAA